MLGSSALRCGSVRLFCRLVATSDNLRYQTRIRRGLFLGTAGTARYGSYPLHRRSPCEVLGGVTMRMNGLIMTFIGACIATISARRESHQQGSNASSARNSQCTAHLLSS